MREGSGSTRVASASAKGAPGIGSSAIVRVCPASTILTARQDNCRRPARDHFKVLAYLYRFREELGDGPPIDPFPGERAGMRNSTRFGRYTPEEIAVPLIQKSIEFLEVGAANIYNGPWYSIIVAGFSHSASRHCRSRTNHDECSARF
jgi:hypothetical protein